MSEDRKSTAHNYTYWTTHIIMYDLQ